MIFIVSVFDIFDVMDETVSSMLESLTGIHIGYGGLFLNNIGEPGTFQISLNGIAMGENEYIFDSILNGKYKLEVIQTRFGKETVIYSELISIIENETIKMEFNIPYFTDTEISRIQSLLSTFEARKNGISDYSTAKETAKELNVMFEDISFCQSLAKYREEIEETIFNWELFEEQLGLIENYEKGETTSLAEIDYSLTEKPGNSINYDMAIFLNRASAFDYFKNLIIKHQRSIL